MLRKLIVVAAAAALVLSFGACKKKEETKPITEQQSPHPGPGGAPNIVMPQGPSEVVVPDNVKGKWDGVKLAIEDKAANKTTDVTVKLNGDYKIPGSNLKIMVGEFLPDFKMDGSKITSVSADSNMPAVQVRVMDGDKQIFPSPESGKQWSWLYSKMPAIHPFQHDKFGITLKEGVKKG